MLAVLATSAVAITRHDSAKRLRLLRERWGQPVDRDRNMGAISRYFRLHIAPHHPASLDDRTWTDLDMDGVFSVLDRTESGVGQQVLYARLRLPFAASQTPAFEALVTALANDAPGRERLQLALSRLAHASSYDLSDLVQHGPIDIRPWHVVFPVLAATMAASIALVPFWPPALLLVIVGTIVSLLFRASIATALRLVAEPFRQVGPLLTAAEFARHHATGAVEPLLGTLQRDRAQLRRLRRIASWAGRDGTGAAMGSIGALVIEYLNVMFCLDANALYFGARELRVHGAALLRVFATVGEVDAAASVASYRAGTAGWIRPAIGHAPPPALRIVGMRHPLLPDAVPNTATFLPPNGLIVTGSNMSGKSTFLRTLGATAVLAQTINTCLAESYDAPPLVVRSCIGRADDPASGRSYYLTEVESVLALIREAQSATPHLLIFDELFRGTNTTERIAAGEAVLATLIAPLPDGTPAPHVVVVATHDLEMVSLLDGSYAASHFGDVVDEEGLSFDYRLRPGVARSRNAIALLAQRGAPASLIERAHSRVRALDNGN